MLFIWEQRGVVSDNEWSGWFRYIKSAFQHGEIYEIWKNNIDLKNGSTLLFKNL